MTRLLIPESARSTHDVRRDRQALAPTVTELTLDFMAAQSFERLIAKWQEEASEQALDGNPSRAHYIESGWVRPLARRLLGELDAYEDSLVSGCIRERRLAERRRSERRGVER